MPLISFCHVLLPKVKHTVCQASYVSCSPPQLGIPLLRLEHGKLVKLHFVAVLGCMFLLMLLDIVVDHLQVLQGLPQQQVKHKQVEHRTKKC